MAELAPVGPKPSQRLPALEGLRGIAAGLVFMVHYASLSESQPGNGPSGGWLDAVGFLGNTGVDLFFGLSGFLIYASLMRRPQPVAEYARRRVVRLYPAFAVVLAAYVAAALLHPGGGRIPAGIGPALAYLAANFALLPGLFPITPLITVAWSLSYEAAFYVVLPLTIWCVRLRRWPVWWRCCLVLLLPVVLQATSSIHGRAGLFACGMLAAECRPLLRRHGAMLGWLAVGAVPVAAAILLRPGADPSRGVAFWADFATVFLLCSCAIGGQGKVAWVLGSLPLRWLGTISYSFYLVHGAVLHGFFVIASAIGLRGGLSYTLLLPAFIACCAASAVLFVLVERRFSSEPGRPSKVPAPPGIRHDARPGASPPRNPNPTPVPASH